MTWLHRIAARIARWLRSRREAERRSHQVRLGAIRYEFGAIREEFEAVGLMSSRMRARFDRLDQLTTERKR